MFPIILAVFWHTALHLMHSGYWCTHLAGHRFQCTPAAPHHVLIRRVPFREMTRLIRHGFECTRAGAWWWCAPDQIPR
jgi:hypothetical protein